MIKDIQDLMVYLPDYKDNQMPDRNYKFQILTTMRNEQVSNILMNARKNRALQEKVDDNELVFVNKEIESVMAQKCKFELDFIPIVTKGNGTFLLKLSAKLQTSRKPAKKFQLSFENLQKEEEEEKRKMICNRCLLIQLNLNKLIMKIIILPIYSCQSCLQTSFLCFGLEIIFHIAISYLNFFAIILSINPASSKFIIFYC